METSLHRQLKSLYRGPDGLLEVSVGPYRVDVVRDGWLIEVQHGPLAGIRQKVWRLLEHHGVVVIKPVVVRRLIVRCRGSAERVVSRRWSPKRGGPLDLFDELVSFVQVFPHPRLVLDVPLVEVEQRRSAGSSKRRARRRGRRARQRVEDCRLLSLRETVRLRRGADLARLIRGRLPEVFHSGDLAAALEVERWTAQRIAYCLRHAGAVEQVGRRRAGRLYRWSDEAQQVRRWREAA